MELKDYPGAIAYIQTQILDLNQEIEQISQSLNRICNQFELQVAFDPELKNDSQRKAKKAELIASSGDYEYLSKDLAARIYGRDRAQIQLEQLKNEFTILKLLKREETARLEAYNEIGV
ncbi:hypothetical protein Ava_D0039 [Trichormus variabilis ATCC 29413]|uniref:Uncharacterized protein n=2 Tax=Anabaena variabilis TaxID=264691 RepID=Q3M2T2_TRIV2|nr:hypothetical protein [Trichormus variabilis]ABA24704.1 hypothetical protein Ava_D0039 [Trichormus variabilis ATCC 29413]MBC1217746.1 hypothetical protein [Trichormus variabilis ARAD]MBC1258963.1 hypothetical protein [Trichormus variabilis V5]MBC1302674.1 hypothetical protein [Trichormus variabilis N2B]MBC1324529.1 hypothetical protein [Trichormus variabilis 9RC]